MGIRGRKKDVFENKEEKYKTINALRGERRYSE